ncbi:long-chain fatty acid--CoA ligase [Alphaproteobacteria bacterium]|nr:long-chain fatty acid--CoA ligase [Alphaproteobacteria bacterium]
MTNYQNLPELFFLKAKENLKNQHLLKINNTTNEIESWTWSDTLSSINKIYQFINSQNLHKEERILLVSENRPEWMSADIAIMSNQLIAVPNYITYTSRDFEHILNDSKPKGLIVSNKNLLDTVLIASKKINYELQFIICFDRFENSTIPNLSFYDDLIEDPSIEPDKYLSIQRNDPASIIYTSGTQGLPKGVVLSHGGILSNCEGAYELLQTLKGSDLTFLTWLPLSHSYEHVVQFVTLMMEAKVFYNKSIETLLPTIKVAKPHIMTAVPRFYNNLFAKMQINLKNQSQFKQNLFNQAILLGTKKLHQQKLSISEKIFDFLLEKLVRKKVLNNFGGRLKAFVSGGGPLDSRVGEALNALGLKTLQGYGLTETSPVVSCNPLHKVKVETVGPIFPGVEVKLAEDGEILVKGENLMLGYWNNPEATKKTIIDGWLHTGDIGEFDEEGYLKITDRKKDIIVSLGGDNIAPSKLENLLTLSSDIEQACVFGEQKNYIAALIILSADSKATKEQIDLYIEKMNVDLSQPEKIKRYHIIDEPFTIENNLMTPTMKVRRHEVEKKYSEVINGMF